MRAEPEDFAARALALERLVSPTDTPDETIVMVLQQALAAAWSAGWLAHGRHVNCGRGPAERED